MEPALIELLITLLIVGVVAAIAYYVISALPIDAALKRIGHLVVGAIALIVILFEVIDLLRVAT